MVYLLRFQTWKRDDEDEPSVLGENFLPYYTMHSVGVHLKLQELYSKSPFPMCLRTP